jgi:hypothetical protein
MSKHTHTTRCTDGPRIVPVRAKSGRKRVNAKRATRAQYWWMLLANGTVSE